MVYSEMPPSACYTHFCTEAVFTHSQGVEGINMFDNGYMHVSKINMPSRISVYMVVKTDVPHKQLSPPCRIWQLAMNSVARTFWPCLIIHATDNFLVYFNFYLIIIIIVFLSGTEREKRPQFLNYICTDMCAVCLDYKFGIFCRGVVFNK